MCGDECVLPADAQPAAGTDPMEDLDMQVSTATTVDTEETGGEQ